MWFFLLLSFVRLERCTSFRKSCYESGVASLEVPADGNCLIWSFRTLYMGIQHCRQRSEADARKEQRLFRTWLKNLWLQRKDSPPWQIVWHALCWELVEEHEQQIEKARLAKVKKEPESEKPVTTPTKAPARPEPSQEASQKKLSTPPRVSDPRKRKVIQTGKAQAASGFGPKDPDHELKAPGCAEQYFLEPKVPSLRTMTTETFEKAMKTNKAMREFSEKVCQSLKRPKEEPKELVGKIELVEDDEEEQEKNDLEMDDWDGNKKRRRTGKFNRTCQKKVVTSKEQKHTAVSKWLAGKGLTYQVFVLKHRKVATMSRAWLCHNEGFVLFKKKLLDRTIFDSHCKGCTLALDECQITLESVDNFEADFQDPGKSAEMAEKLEEDPKQIDEAKKTRKRKLKDEELLLEYKRCIDYVAKTGGAEIEIEEASEPPSVLYYKCKICKNKANPEGKMNYLGPPKFNAVKFYLHQHLECPTHVRNRNRLQLLQAPPEEGSSDDRCPGYWVSEQNPSPTGSLYHYQTEFQLWCTNAKIDGELTRHQYFCDFAKGEWYCRHRSCSGRMSQDRQPCVACQSLGECSSVQRQVFRFATKWYAGLLLNKRLFRPSQEVDDFVAKLQNTAFGSRCSMWSSLLKLDNSELQQWTRRSFAKNGEATENLARFVDSVVSPSLRVHVSSIDCQMRSLFEQFSAAIDTNQLSAPQIMEFI